MVVRGLWLDRRWSADERLAAQKHAVFAEYNFYRPGAPATAPRSRGLSGTLAESLSPRRTDLVAGAMTALGTLS